MAAGLNYTRWTHRCRLRASESDHGPWPIPCVHVCYSWHGSGLSPVHTCFLQLQPMKLLVDMPWSRLRRCVAVRQLRLHHSENPPSIVVLSPSVHYIVRGSVLNDTAASQLFRDPDGDSAYTTFWEEGRGFAADAADFITSMQRVLPRCSLLLLREAPPTGFAGFADGLFRGGPSHAGSDCSLTGLNSSRNDALNARLDSVVAGRRGAVRLRLSSLAARALREGVDRWWGWEAAKPGQVAADCSHLRCGHVDHLALVLVAKAAQRLSAPPGSCTAEDSRLREPPASVAACPQPAPPPTRSCHTVRKWLYKPKKVAHVHKCSWVRHLPWPPLNYSRTPAL
eukprot:TRINITY_DN20720_c0_g1_i1.p1 TRINITY_DN20720_c0_g1~~TRINITY_DN20720_c0_g1_i1.p1  ORF type:complete len:339 (+),score=85.60 TRINITY_DN20720_c0_g1_i1:525-1541(+)